MDYEEELEALQNDALSELEDNNDTDTNDNQQEESIDSSDDIGEDEEDREDFEGNEDEDDQEDDNEFIDEEDSDEEEDDQADSSDIDNEEDSSGFENVEVQMNGQTITLESEEELRAFVKNNRGNTVETHQKKSKNDRTMEQGNLTQDDLGLLIDAKNGDPAAIAKLAKMAKVDVYDMDEDLADSYVPKFSPQEISAVDEVAEEIMSDEKHYTDFRNVVENLPKDFVAAVSVDANALKHLSGQIRSGIAQEVIPIAMKKQMLEGGSFLENYISVGREITQDKNGKPEDSKTKRKRNPRAEKLKDKARNSKGSNKGTKTVQTGEDIWAMSTKDFNKKYLD